MDGYLSQKLNFDTNPNSNTNQGVGCGHGCVPNIGSVVRVRGYLTGTQNSVHKAPAAVLLCARAVFEPETTLGCPRVLLRKLKLRWPIMTAAHAGAQWWRR